MISALIRTNILARRQEQIFVLASTGWGDSHKHLRVLRTPRVGAVNDRNNVIGQTLGILELSVMEEHT